MSGGIFITNMHHKMYEANLIPQLATHQQQFLVKAYVRNFNQKFVISCRNKAVCQKLIELRDTFHEIGSSRDSDLPVYMASSLPHKI